MKKVWSVLLLCAGWMIITAWYAKPEGEEKRAAPGIKPAFLEEDTRWVDSVMRSLSPEARIGQLFMVAAYSNRDAAHEKEITELVREYHIGGLIFFQGGPVRQAQLTNRYQQAAAVPLLIAMDAEWGLAMRLDSTLKFPKQMTLGALRNDTLVYLMGREIARECIRLGVHINFAPVADINNNPDNPVINFRSFGEDRINVTRKSAAYMKGMQDLRVMANAKHFPGHGDTDTDSHLALPVIPHSRSRLDSLELYPFQVLFRGGMASVMVAHLYIPALEKTAGLASTLSRSIIRDLLREEMGFEGLIFTDALNMKGVSDHYGKGEVAVKALLAGNDVLLFPEDVPAAVKGIQKAIANGEITQQEIDRRCRRILLAKKWVRLDQYRPVNTENLVSDLQTSYAKSLLRRLTAGSLTLLRNEADILPLKRLDTLRIAVVSIGDTLHNTFQTSLSRYAALTHFSLPAAPRGGDVGALVPKLRDYNLLIVGLHSATNRPSEKFGITPEAVAFISNQRRQRKVIVAHFGNAYGLRHFAGASLLDGLVMAYENSEEAKDLAGQLIFGGIACNGQLPVNASAYFKLGDGLAIEKPVRLGYVLPEELGIRSADLLKIDSLAMRGVIEKAYPGCQVLAAKKGKVFYYRSFGYHTYDSLRQVSNTDLYDLASVSKIAGTVSALMRLTDEKKFSLDHRLRDYLPGLLDSSEYGAIQIRRMLAHEAGLVAWIPFYQATLNTGKWKEEIYRKQSADSFRLQVADNLYILDTYRDSIFAAIKKTPLRKQRNYLYSDVGYYFLQEIVERITRKGMDRYMDSLFYIPLGAQTLGYNPLKRFDKNRVTPTEDDKIYRKQLIHGYVHDQGAAMLGGVAGHAGLFSNANDLAIMMQMLMNYGTYGGEKYLEAATVKEYARCQFCPGNRRGAGFDRPTMTTNSGPTCNCVTKESFGHTGFTGITAWADPGPDVIYIFLSNRSYPIADNPKILRMGVRTDIQQAFYNALSRSEALN